MKHLIVLAVAIAAGTLAAAPARAQDMPPAAKLRGGAREGGVAGPRRKAEIYAKAAGVTLGAPLSISEEGSPGPMPFRKMAAGMAVSAPVAQGEETLAVTVSVSWAIKQAGQ